MSSTSGAGFGRDTVTAHGVLLYLSERIAKWWLPDDVVFVPELPRTATGKLLKKALRDEYQDYRLPTV